MTYLNYLDFGHFNGEPPMALTKSQMQRFKKHLEELREQILSSLRTNAAEVKRPDEATGYSQHQADQGTDDFDRRINLEVTSQEFELLRKIDHALESIAEGTYGKCEISGEDIPVARLEAMPYVTTTVKAQRMIEQGLI
jgi:DnaK suppressor protein